MLTLSIAGSIGFVLSFFLTHLLKDNATKWSLMDIPNHRSSHNQPTPKAGGLAMFVSFILVTTTLLFRKDTSYIYIAPLLWGAPFVVLVGWLDDRFQLSVIIRLAFHFGVSVFIFGLVTQWFSAPVEVSFLPKWYWINALFCVFFIAWFINLYNFMDGSDGLAASMAITASVLLAIITFVNGVHSVALTYCLLAYCVGGFLCFNWSPAKIFMGDCGAYFLGFVFATLALVCKMYSDISFYSHIIIFGCFIIDATYTLLARLFRGARVYEAHREHGFQKAIISGWPHKKVAVVYNLITLIWFFPFAMLAMVFHDYGIALVVLSYVPFTALMVYFRAGLPGQSSSSKPTEQGRP